MAKDLKEHRDKLLAIVSSAVEQDVKLRAELKIGDKFRFIRDRLQMLKEQTVEALKVVKVQEVEAVREADQDEQLVYVYLFNARGVDLQSWLKMLHPSVYYEHSVNRPIYELQEQVDLAIRNKTNRVQHGYLAMAVKKTAIVKDGELTKDNIGQPLLKIKDGSLRPERLIYFWHNGQQYRKDEEGLLEKIN